MVEGEQRQYRPAREGVVIVMANDAAVSISALTAKRDPLIGQDGRS